MFKGADTDQLRLVASKLNLAAQAVDDIMNILLGDMYRLQWHGPDAEHLHELGRHTRATAGTHLAELLRDGALHLRNQARVQDETSGMLFGAVGVGGLFPFDLLPHSPWPFGGYRPAWLLDPFSDAWRLMNGDLDGVDVPIWSADFDAAVRRWGSEGSTQFGPITLAGASSLALLSAAAGASAGLSFGRDGLALDARGHAGAYLLDANASGSAQWGIASMSGEARGFVGADASANAGLHIGPDGASASIGGEAFAGAKASAEAGVNLGGVGGTAKGEVWAGVGIEGDADLQVTADHVKISVSAGAALGIGGSIAFEVDVNPKEVVDNIGSFLNPFD